MCLLENKPMQYLLPKHQECWLGRPRIDITGKTFSNVKVLEFIGSKNTSALYKCECLLCHKIFNVTYSNLSSGNTKACGSCRKRTHRKKHHPLYRRWQELRRNGLICEKWQDINAFLDDTESTFEKGCTLNWEQTTKGKIWKQFFAIVMAIGYDYMVKTIEMKQLSSHHSLISLCCY